ncbi:LysR family transcriptional regulator [Photobacterium sagamiensis]|uniref:LysR family transcriptional regulator n=1 Tax=Photobacterium sagamiensis TaxID=2910241 RepID=UPI003D0971E5
MDKLLRQFKAVAQHKNLSTACEQLHITQPALTRNIKKLEDKLGVLLFERMPRGMAITHYGEILLKRANRIEKEYMYALREIQAVQQGEEVKLRIGADNLWAEAYLTDILSEFYRMHPLAEVRVKAGPVSSLLPKLIEGKIDVILGNIDCHVKSDLYIVKEKLVDVKFHVIARKEHPLHQSDNIDIETLSENKWVIYQQSDDYVWHVNELFYNKGTKPAKISLHTAFLPQAITLMQNHNFLMYVPDKLIGYMQQQGLFPLKSLEPIHQFNSGIWYQRNIMELHGPRSLLSITNSHLKRAEKPSSE